jgi:hypothetical protein
MSLPEKLARLEIETRGPLDGQVRVPGSKSITNRALLLAALADGESRLLGGLESDDVRAVDSRSPPSPWIAAILEQPSAS